MIKLIDAIASDTQYKRITLIYLLLGLRECEAIGLTWKKVHLNRDTPYLIVDMQLAWSNSCFRGAFFDKAWCIARSRGAFREIVVQNAQAWCILRMSSFSEDLNAQVSFRSIERAKIPASQKEP